MALYLDDDHPESINVRHLGGTSLVIWACKNFRCNPTKTVGGNVARGNRRNSEITDWRDPPTVKQNVQLMDNRQQTKPL